MVLADKISQWLNSVNPKDQEECVVIQYGLELFFDNISKLILIQIIGCVVGKGIETFVILLVFCLLRLQAGGFHAKSNLKCTLGMLVIWGVPLVVDHYIHIVDHVLIFIFILTAVVILIYAPQTKNISYFTEDDMLKRKRYSIMILFVDMLAAWIFSDFRQLIAISVAMEAITLFPVNKIQIAKGRERS